MRLDSRPTVIDCFAGAGGLSLGFTMAGLEVRAAFDHSPTAVSTYQRNLGGHIVQADAKQISGRDLLSVAGLNKGDCSIVAGGPPCQGFSTQRRGDDNDDRNDLIFEFLRIVSEISPSYFLMENVPALLNTRGKPHCDLFLIRARDIGYRTYASVLNAADFGVAQIRKRAFIVGERLDQPPAFAFPSPTHSAETWMTVKDAIRDLPSPNEDQPIPNHEAPNISKLNIERISYVPPGGGRADIPVGLRLPCHAVSVEKAGHRGVYGRLDWNRPAGTVTTKCNSFTRGRFAHPDADRNITMREAARLQSFPDDFVFAGGTVAAAHQVGNAVPPLLARCLGLSLRDALEGRTNVPIHQLALNFGESPNELRF